MLDQQSRCSVKLLLDQIITKYENLKGEISHQSNSSAIRLNRKGESGPGIVINFTGDLNSRIDTVEISGPRGLLINELNMIKRSKKFWQFEVIDYHFNDTLFSPTIDLVVRKCP
ncbi:hypothetical protein [Persicobacter diffluens]|uniref:Uncharacterized protein n=1 Tax=Persicobacter diffluens TaxID=981 RepID=A0AAN4W445_9BACT|nr:hypothetical protein PEDI_44990 [Persicobacter diffluens]